MLLHTVHTQVCDCINGPGLKAGSLAIDLPDGLEAHLNLTTQLISSFLETKIEKLRLSPIVEKVRGSGGSGFCGWVGEGKMGQQLV